MGYKMPKSPKNNNRYKPYITWGVAGGKALYKAYSAYKELIDVDKKGQTTTNTENAVTQYKKRRSSKKSRKRGKKAFKRFVKNALKLVGSNTVVVNHQMNVAGVAGTGQIVQCVTLGGKSWEVDTQTCVGSNDMRKVLGNDDRLAKSTNNSKALISSARADITYRNNGAQAAEVDMYVIKHYGDKHIGSYTTEIQRAEARTPLPPGATGTDPTMITRGLTLFDFPILSKMGNQIIKKVKAVVPSGGVLTHSFNARKNTWFDAQEITGTSPTDADHYVKHGFTTSVVFVTKPIVGFAETSINPIIGATNVYRYKVFSDNRDFNTYNPT